MKIVRALTAAIFLCLSFGCVGVQYTDKIQEVDLTQSEKNKISVRVLAKAESWRNSGVFVKKDHKYNITAKGRWRVGGLCGWTGPDGTGCYTPLCWDSPMFRFIEGWSHCTLLGKIGKDGKPFAIGDDYELVAREDGVLYFHINDNGSCGDNEGMVTVTTALPEAEIARSETGGSLPAVGSKQTAGEGRRASGFATSTGRNWAVIIGISKYKHTGPNGLERLIFADDDAKSFARVLHNLGWSESHIKLLINEDATQRNVMIALESWLTKADEKDKIVLFWSGHGFPDPEDPEKVYFACFDTDISVPATGYRMDRVRQALEERKCRNVVLFADTCHAGKLITRGSRGLSIVPQIDRMRREGNAPKGWIFMVGADTDRQAIEHSSWSNGAFTHCLIKGLYGAADGYESVGEKDGILTMGELRAYLNSVMPEETQRVLGVAKRPVIATSSGDPNIWKLNLQER
jgi:hypothetical protein